MSNTYCVPYGPSWEDKDWARDYYERTHPPAEVATDLGCSDTEIQLAQDISKEL